MSGKDKLISVEHLKWNVGGIKCGTLTVDYLNWILDHEEPAVDAEPVRHGKWIKADSQQYFRKHYPFFTCSECGYRKDSQKKWNYCPNCGADMRGEKEWTK